MANYDDLKLEALGLLSEGNSAKDVARQLSIPYPKVLKWKPEADSLQTKADLETVLDLDKIVLHDIANETKNKMDNLVEGGGELVDKVLDNIDSIGVLQTNLQASAIAILVKLNTMIDSCRDADELHILVESISKLQVAFFAKGANVNVLNMPGSQQSEAQINAFKSLQRPM